MNTPKQSMIFMSAWLIFQFLISLLGAAFILGGMELITAQILVQIAGGIVPVLAAYLIYKKRKWEGGFIPLAPPKGRLLILSAFLGLLVQPSAMLISALSSVFDSAPVDTITEVITTAPPWTVMLIVGIIPPITEELAARGVALNGFMKVTPWKAAVINGIIFGIMHMNFRQFFYAFALGAVISAVVIRGGNIVYGMVMHFVINVSQAWMAGLTEMTESGAAAFGAGYIAVLPVSIYLCFFIFRRFPKASTEISNTEEVKPITWAFWVYIILGVFIMAAEFL